MSSQSVRENSIHLSFEIVERQWAVVSVVLVEILNRQWPTEVQ